MSSAILDWQDVQRFKTAHMLRKINVPHRAKFHHSHENYCAGAIAIFQVFKMEDVRHFGFYKS